MRYTLKALDPRLRRCAERTGLEPRTIRRLALTALLTYIEEHGYVILPVRILHDPPPAHLKKGPGPARGN